MKRKASFPFAFLSFFRNFALIRARRYSVLAKKETSFFVLRSTFRNFGFAELTLHSEKLK
jgi:hypothetical protein